MEAISSPLPLRRSTQLYCPRCHISAEDYRQSNCDKCKTKNVKWVVIGETIGGKK